MSSSLISPIIKAKSADSGTFSHTMGFIELRGLDSNQRPPGYERQSQTAHRRPPGDPILGSLTIFGFKEPGGLRLMNRRPDFSLEASPGDDFAWKIMIPFKSARKFSGFGSNHSFQNRRPDSSLLTRS